MLKYQLLSKEIEKDIDSGVLQPGEMIPSVRKLTSTYNVSRPTVEKSLETLKESGKLRHLPGLGYFVQERPTAAIGHIAFVTHLLASDASFYVEGLTDGLDAEKYTLSTFAAHADLEKYQQSIEQLAQLKPTGIILHTLPYELCQVDLTPLVDVGIPIVAIESYHPELVCDRVLISPQNYKRKIVNYICEKDLSDLAIFMGSRSKRTKDSITAWIDKLKNAGIEVPDERIFLFDVSHGYSNHPDPFIDSELKMTEILKNGFRGTFICGHGYPAIGALRAVLKAGIKVPEEVKIIASMNCAADVYAPMKITTVDFHPEEIAHVAAELLIRRIEGYKGPLETHYVSGTLIEGETT